MLVPLLLVAAIGLPAGVMGALQYWEHSNPARQTRRTVRTRNGALVTVR